MKDILSRLGLIVTDMRDADPEALCDGGDILYTGRHLFAGLSERTNMAAVKVLSDGLNFETIAVPFEGEALHLKSIVTHMDSTTLLAPIGTLGDQVLEAMKANERGYTVIRLPNMLACNVVSVNGGILAQDAGCSESRALLEYAATERNMQIEFVDSSETAKCDGALTCCSVLLDIDDITTAFFPEQIQNRG
jgi:dimethylargininase